ncbi:hypothetical protein STEG23_017857, partial [Scotinomys teguina]
FDDDDDDDDDDEDDADDEDDDDDDNEDNGVKNKHFCSWIPSPCHAECDSPINNKELVRTAEN